MSFFNRFPYTNFHDLNLDWLLEQWHSFKAYVDEKLKNAGINYVLPAAKRDSLGGIKVGDQLDVTEDGTLNNAYVLQPATRTSLGGVKVGNNLAVTPDGTIHAVDQSDAEMLDFDNFPSFYVNPVIGNDTTGNGSYEYPWASLKHALDAIQTNSTCTIRLQQTINETLTGTYTISTKLRILGDRNYSQQITFNRLDVKGYLRIGDFASETSDDSNSINITNLTVHKGGTLLVYGQTNWHNCQWNTVYNHGKMILQQFSFKSAGSVGIVCQPGSSTYIDTMSTFTTRAVAYALIGSESTVFGASSLPLAHVELYAISGRQGSSATSTYAIGASFRGSVYYNNLYVTARESESATWTQVIQ